MDEMKNKPLVSICSITYNHAPYIRQCLEGFLMQKTNFPFEVIINDDCSTDGTTEILREYAEKYPDIIKPIYHDENLYSKGQRGFYKKFCFPKAEGEYIALCEGDDYWIDPLKLQKQVDFLEENPEYVMVYTGFLNVNQNGEIIQRKYHDTLMNKSKSGWIFPNLLWENFIMTLSVCVRRNTIVGNTLYEHSPFTYDYSLFLCSSIQGKIKFFPDIMGAYRKQPAGAVATLGSKLQHMADPVRLYVIQSFFINRKEIPFIRRIKTYWAIDKLILRNKSTHKDDFLRLLRLNPVLVIFLIPVAISRITSKLFD